MNKKMKLIIFLLMIFLISLLTACALFQGERRSQGEAQYNLGVASFTSGDYRTTLAHLQKAVDFDSTNHNYYHALGLTYFRLRMNDKAIEAYKNAVNINPLFSEAHNDLGVAYSLEKKWDLAFGHWRQALENPIFAMPEQVHYNMGVAYAAQDKLDDAYREFRNALDLYPQFPDCYYQMGVILYKKERYEEAVSFLQKAVEMMPALLDAQHYLGLTYFKLDKKPKAKEQFEKVMQMAPQSERAREARGYLKSLE